MTNATQPPGMGRTTISVSDELADELYARKGRGESYEDVLWRLVEQSSGETTQSDRGSEPTAATEQPPAPEPEPAEPTLDEHIEQVGEDVLPGSGSKLEERKEAFRAAVEYLREEGRATPGDFQSEVYPQHPARYTTGANPERSWWKNCIYKGLSELAERTEAIERPDTTGEWVYTGEA